MLKSKNIELRALEPSDVDLLYEWENNEELWHLSNTITPFSRFVLEQYVLNSHQDIYTAKQLRLMIDKNEADKKVTIGGIDLFDFDPVNKRAGIGIMIIAQERKKGFASEALNQVIQYCFKTLLLHQLYCNIAIDNKDSYNLFRKHNFELVGLKKDWLIAGKGWKDEYLLQKINPMEV
jgi:diamine N-acetyltransferase